MSEEPQDKLLFSVAGARGIVGSGLNVDVVTRLTLAFGTVLPPGPIVVGRDTRPSGTSLLSAVVGAVTSTRMPLEDRQRETLPAMSTARTQL